MARSTIAVALGSTNSTALVTGTLIAADASHDNGYKIIAETRDDKFGMLFTNNGATGTVRVIASDAMTAYGQGDATFNIKGGSTLAPGAHIVGPLEGARFRRTNGDIYIDSAIDGTAYAFQL